MLDRIAVIMSVYRNDTLEYVSKSIWSLLNQTYSLFDIFIQCDGPIKDDVDDYLSSIDDNRITVFKRTENHGLARSLNDLLSVVLPKGYKYIARMDADDYCSLERFEKQIAYFDKHPIVDCLGTWAIEIDANGKEYFKKQMPESHIECEKLFHKRDCMIHPTVMFRSSFFEKSGYYATDTFFGEDTMMWAQGFKAGCVFANVPEFLYYFRVDDHFFERRRGWNYAKGIYELRRRVNKTLGYGIKENLYALAYAVVKMMPTPILNLIYRTMR